MLLKKVLRETINGVLEAVLKGKHDRGIKLGKQR